MKKFMHKSLSFILVLSIGLCLFSNFSFSSPVLLESGYCGENIQNVWYRFDSSTGLLRIGGSVKMDGGYFEYKHAIKNVIIGDGVTSIGNRDFYACSGLKSITLPNSLRYIGDSAFSGCGLLSSITIPDSVINIGDSAFFGCNGLRSVTFPNSLRYIGESAFSGCSRLTNIILPNSVTSIGVNAFFGCSGLISITVNENNRVYDSRENCNAIINTTNNALIVGCKNTIIPNSVTDIDTSAFSECSGLTNIIIPDSVTSIGDSAFFGCNGIKELTMPCSAKIYNSENTFKNCTNIKKVTLTQGTGKMQNYSNNQYTPWYISRSNLKELVIGEGVQNIVSGAFYGCSSLTSIIIPDSVKSIGESAFQGCSSLRTVTIGNSVTRINNTVFSGCNNLNSLTIGTGMETIDKTAFTTLNQITLPANLDIDFTCFDNCENIQTINLSCGNGKMLDWSMDYEKSLWYLHRDTIKEINLEEGVAEISESAFCDCTNLIKSTVPSTVKRIGSYAYSGCKNLRNITIYSLDCVIPDNPNTIEAFATIYGYDNSTAQAYAQKYNRTFISLGEYVCREHKYTVKNIVSKANAVGYTLHTCSRCGKTFKDNFTNPIGKPAGFKCASRTATSEKFTWNKTSGASGYQVQLLNSAGKSAGTATTTGNAYTFSKLAAGHAYKARVRFYIKAADGKNYYGAWVTINSPTLPKATKVTSATAAKKAFTAKWGKVAGVTGYQLQYATNAKFTKVTTKTIKGATKYSLKVASLKGGTKYFVRVRTYKTIGGKNYYSTWSPAKAVKTK